MSFMNDDDLSSTSRLTSSSSMFADTMISKPNMDMEEVFGAANNTSGSEESAESMEEESMSSDACSGEDTAIVPTRKRKKMSVLARREASQAKELDELMDSLDKRRRGRRKKATSLNIEMGKIMGEANNAFISNDFKKAVDLLHVVIKGAPQAQQPYQTLGLIYEEMNEMKKALHAYTVAAYLNSKEKTSWSRLSKMALEYNEYKMCIFCCDKVLRQDRNNIEHLFLRSLSQIELGEHKKAVNGLELILQRDPLSTETIRYLADEYHLSNQMNKAIILIEKYIAMIEDKNNEVMQRNIQNNNTDPQPSLSLLNLDLKLINILCELYILNKDYRTCISMIDKVNKMNQSLAKKDQIKRPLPVYLIIKFGICKLHLGQISDSERFFNVVLNKDPNEYGDLYLSIAEAYIEANLSSHALDILRTLSNTTSYNTPSIWIKISHCIRDTAVKHEDLYEAIDSLLNVLEKEPNNIPIRITLSELYRTIGNYDLAVSIVQTENNKSDNNINNVIINYNDLLLLHQACLARYEGKKFKMFLKLAQPKIEATISAAKGLYEDNDKDNIEVEEPSLFDAPFLEAARIERIRQSSYEGKSKKILKTKEFIDIIIKSSMILSLLNNNKLAGEYIGFLESIMSHKKKIKKQETEDKLYQIRYVCAKIYYRLNRIEEAYRYIRLATITKPNSTFCTRLLCQIMNKMNFNNKSIKFVEKMVQKHPLCINLRILIGHAYMFNQNYTSAYASYIYSFIQSPNTPSISLFLAISCLCSTMRPRVSDKHINIYKCFAYFFNYYRLSNRSKESAYNLGRAFHYISLNNYAIYFYNICLETSNYNCTSNVFKYRKEAAHNLAQIYMKSGSPHLARELYRDHCTI